MFDLHTHIIPRLDDGSRHEEMSLAMLTAASETGTWQMVATPHIVDGTWRPLWEDIIAGCAQLQSAVRKAQISLSILPGAEVTLYPNVLDFITGPGAYCINAGRYMLVEFPSSNIPLYADTFLFALQNRGITPILAHPERYRKMGEDYSILEKWTRQGILVQINGSSLTGQMGQKLKNIAQNLLKRDLVHCIGSDAHDNFSRSADLAMARKIIQESVGRQKAEQILFKNPDRIINSQDIKYINSGWREWYEKKVCLAGSSEFLI